MNNLINQTFGKLTVISKSHSTNRIIWNCQCECGNTCKASGDDLKRRNNISCGCSRKKEYGYAAMIKLLADYKRHARLRNVEFSLTEDEFIFLTKQDCYYCGCEPSQTKVANGNGEYIYNGIDRIDSKLGYTIDNCVTSCCDCNYMKNSLTQNDFFDMIKKIYEYQDLVNL